MVTVYRTRVLSPRVEVPFVTGATGLSVKRAQVTFDATWSPYVQGSLTCRRLSAADATATDPRKGLLARFTLSHQRNDDAATTLDFTTWLETRVNDFQADEATLTFGSVESIMQDHADLSGQEYTATTVQDTDVVTDAVRKMPLGNAGRIAISTAGAAAAYGIAGADAGWDSGTSVWDIINGVEAPKSIWTHGDETGLTLFRQPAGYSPDTSTRYLYGTDRILTVLDTIDRKSPDFANGVFINYTSAKGTKTTTDSGLQGSPQVPKYLVINRTGRRTATGEASARAARMVKRGRSLQITAIADLTCRPNQNWFVGFRDVTWYGIVRAVTFRWPEGLMDITLDVTESQS